MNEGMKFKGHPEDWGVEQAEDIHENHYHQPSDEFDRQLDFTGDAEMARFGFALGWQAACASRAESDGSRATSSSGSMKERRELTAFFIRQGSFIAANYFSRRIGRLPRR